MLARASIRKSLIWLRLLFAFAQRIVLELQAFFTFSRAEHELIQARRGNALKLGLALHIGFLRMSGRLLDAVRVVPPGLWRHLGNELGIDAPEIASLRAMYGRGRTLFDHQQVACEALGFRWMAQHRPRWQSAP